MFCSWWTGRLHTDNAAGVFKRVDVKNGFERDALEVEAIGLRS